MIKAIYFDLFFTLIIPAYEQANNEFDILNLSAREWERYAENDMLYRKRALGLAKTEKGTLVFDNPIQRAGSQWSVLQKSLLIRSMLLGYPIPPVYFLKRNAIALLTENHKCYGENFFISARI